MSSAEDPAILRAELARLKIEKKNQIALIEKQEGMIEEIAAEIAAIKAEKARLEEAAARLRAGKERGRPACKD